VCGISCGGIHNAVFTDDGQVYTWGCSDDGSLGRPGDESTPLLVEGLGSETIIGVACGDGQTIAVSTTGSVWGWGCYKDKEGKKWFNPSEAAAVQHKDIKKQQDTPIRIQGISNAIDIACGSVCNLARCDDGKLYSWGLGECGELARKVPPLKKGEEYDLEGMLRYHLTPGLMYAGEGSSAVPVSNAKSIGCGSYHCFVVVVRDKGEDRSGGGMDIVGGSGSDSDQYGVSVLTCGLNNYGQLGLGGGNTTNMSYLTEVAALRDLGVVSLVGGAHHSLAMTACGTVYAFGRGDSGQLGVTSMASNAAGDFSSEPLEVDLGGAEAVSIACGANHNLVITSKNDIYSWGYGDMLALGHGKERDELVPKKLNFEKAKIDRIKVTQVSGGGQHSAIIGRVLTTI
jgi:regulator of chromosome condensation